MKESWESSDALANYTLACKLAQDGHEGLQKWFGQPYAREPEQWPDEWPKRPRAKRRVGWIILAAAILAIGIVTAAAAKALDLTYDDYDAIGRVVYAEAANEPDAGRVAVIDTILNRVADGNFGGSVQAVIEQRNAFEPVTRAGGWRNLPSLTTEQKVQFATYMGLKAAGVLGDVSGSALYFQNVSIVRDRVRVGKVRPSLVNFGGMPVTADLGQHTFYSTKGSKPGVTVVVKDAGETRFAGDEETAFQ